MNKHQRKQIQVLIEQVDAIHSMPSETVEDWKAIASLLESTKAECEDLRDEEQEKLDNMPENMQGGDRYSVIEEAVSSLEDAISAFDEALDVAEDKDRDLDAFEDVVRESVTTGVSTPCNRSENGGRADRGNF